MLGRFGIGHEIDARFAQTALEVRQRAAVRVEELDLRFRQVVLENFYILKKQ